MKFKENLAMLIAGCANWMERIALFHYCANWIAVELYLDSHKMMMFKLAFIFCYQGGEEGEKS